MTRLTWVVILASVCACSSPRMNVLVPDGSTPFALMDFSEPLPLDPVPEGWRHRTFWRHPPMDISFVEKEGRHAIRLETHDSASMLFRHVEVELDAYSALSWDWYVEQGIESEVDEMTTAGDDHPARLFLDFESADGDGHAMEIIWGNVSLRAGDWKHLEFFGLFSFPHYVARGGAEHQSQWHHERVDLRALYQQLWGDPTGARLVDIGLFCDTDETGAHSIAYFSSVRVERD